MFLTIAQFSELWSTWKKNTTFVLCHRLHTWTSRLQRLGINDRVTPRPSKDKMSHMTIYFFFNLANHASSMPHRYSLLAWWLWIATCRFVGSLFGYVWANMLQLHTPASALGKLWKASKSWIWSVSLAVNSKFGIGLMSRDWFLWAANINGFGIPSPLKTNLGFTNYRLLIKLGLGGTVKRNNGIPILMGPFSRTWLGNVGWTDFYKAEFTNMPSISAKCL